MAMGVGLASVRGDKNATSDSFGLAALSSVGPVAVVFALFQLMTHRYPRRQVEEVTNGAVSAGNMNSDA